MRKAMRLGWATDIHLNFLNAADCHQFIAPLREKVDALVTTGDIAESNSIGKMLRQIDAWLERPVYFVLGNHDYYRGSVVDTRANVAEVTNGCKNLIYLSQAGIIELTSKTALVGHDGWADGRLGDLDRSEEILNDFLLIDELRCWKDPHTLDKPALRRALQVLGDEAAGYLKGVLVAAVEKYPHVIVATHVPPFGEAAWYEGRPSSDDFLPFFASKAMGEVLLEAAQLHPKCQILVLCGHTHGGGELQVSENLRVVTGSAEYGSPQIQQILDVE
jgi:3',5'-cyclic-AMP phosphodiesterase